MKFGRLLVPCLAAAALLAATGCVSAPYIDELLVELDSRPLTEFVKKPITPPPTPIAPLPRESLVGKWSAVFSIYERCNGYSSETGPTRCSIYTFEADGRYSEFQVDTRTYNALRTGEVSAHSDSRTIRGRWSYADGMLTLTRETLEDRKVGVLRQAGIPAQRRVVWYTPDELSFRKLDAKLNSDGQRATFTYDQDGAECQRIIIPTRVVDGREQGTVFEMARPLARYERMKK